jgi:hypothetical protein
MGFRTSIFPPRPDFSTDLEMRGRHRVGFMNIFERGGTIKGRPLLWVPLSSAPKKIGGRRLTARLYIQKIGPLHRINRSGKPPLLAGFALRAPAGKISAAQLRTGAKNAATRGRRRRAVSVPIFVGLPSVRIRDRLNVSAVYEKGRRDLPVLYAKHLAGLNR